MNNISRPQRLFKDWLSTLKTSEKRRVLESLKNEKGVFAYNSLVKAMGQDAATMRKMFEEVKPSLNEDSKKAKELFCQKLLEAAEKKESERDIMSLYTDGGLNQDGYTSYAALTGQEYGNNIPSDIQVTANGLVTQIIRAIVGGNMAIAAQLTMSGWNNLTGGDKMSIFNVATVQSGYNTGGEKSKIVSKDQGEAKFYVKQMKTEIADGSISKDSFVSKAFPRSDGRYLTLGNLESDSDTKKK